MAQRKTPGQEKATAQLVIYAGGIAAAFVDQADAAADYAKAAGAVVVELPVVVDHRNKPDQSDQADDDGQDDDGQDDPAA